MLRPLPNSGVGPFGGRYVKRAAVRVEALPGVEPQTTASAPQVAWSLVAQNAFCVVPAAVLFALGSPPSGAKLFFTVLLLFLARYILLKDRIGFISLTVSVIPALMTYRGFFFYNVVSGILMLGVLLWLFAAPREVFYSCKNPRLRWLLFLAGCYWFLSYFLTKDYVSNLRVLELAATVVCIQLLVRYWNIFVTTLIGVSVSIFSIGCGFLPHGGARLGMADFEGFTIGNPMTLGVPLALIFVLAFTDNGK